MKIKAKFLVIIIGLVVFITAALVWPLTALMEYNLLKLSKKDTNNLSAIVSSFIEGKIYEYYSGSDSEKLSFKIDLQDQLTSIKSDREMADVLEIFVIDNQENIIAHSDENVVDKTSSLYKEKYVEYKQIVEFNEDAEKRILTYNDYKQNNPQEIVKIKKKIEKIEKKLADGSGKTEELSLKKIELENEIKRYNQEIVLADQMLPIADKRELEFFISPVFISRDDAYTLFHPIIGKLKSGKQKYFGSVMATISTREIKEMVFTARLFAIGIGLLVLLCAVALINFVARIIVNPIQDLTLLVKEVASGDLSKNIPVKGKDEIATLGGEFNKMIAIWREKLHMQKYVSKSTQQMITEAQTTEKHVSPERKEITIFFSDVRGFTSFSESHDALEVINRINELFDIQVPIIEKHGGDIDKFVGDEIMALFPNPAAAFKAAVEIQQNMRKLNKTKKEPLQIGIGINYGEAILGDIGSSDSLDWTAIGDTVNLGARLCSSAPADRIILSEYAFKKIKTSVAIEEGAIRVKGKNKEIKIYTI